MKEQLLEAYEAIHNINEDLWNQFEDETIRIDLTVSDTFIRSDFYAANLWDSRENIRREFIEDTNKYEPLEPYLRRQLNETIDIFKQIKV